MKSYENISYHTIQEPVFQPTATFFKELSTKLEQASSQMMFCQFEQMFIEIVKRCIKKAQVDSSFNALQYLQKWSSMYCTNMEITARILVLEAHKIEHQVPPEALKKLNKVKHIIIDTPTQYLLTKVFVEEARIHEITGDKEQQFKTLKKCIQYGQNYAMQFLKQTQQIRMEIADNMIIAYFQMFKQTKQTKPNASVNYLSKAYHSALKNYGGEHFSTQNLFNLLQQQKNLMMNIDKISPKALTEIYNIRKKYSTTLVQYSWEEEVIVIQLFRKEEDDHRLVKETTLNVKLDMNKIKTIQNSQNTDWLKIKGTEIFLNSDQLFKIIEKIPAEESRITKNIGINFKNVSRDDIFKKNGDSSSSDDEGIINQPHFSRYNLKDIHNYSRSKSRQGKN